MESNRFHQFTIHICERAHGSRSRAMDFGRLSVDTSLLHAVAPGAGDEPCDATIAPHSPRDADDDLRPFARPAGSDSGRPRGQEPRPEAQSPIPLPPSSARDSQMSDSQPPTPHIPQEERSPLRAGTSPLRSPLRSPMRRHVHDTKELLKYIDLDRNAYAAAVSNTPAEIAHVHGLDLEINAKAVRALREDDGPLHKLQALKDEISDFNALFAKKKAKADKIAAAGKKKMMHVDKVKLVQLDRKFHFEMHYEFDLYESFRLGRFCRNHPHKAQQILKDQQDLEAREEDERRQAMEVAAVKIQKIYRAKLAQHEARRMKIRQMHALRDTRSSHGGSRGSRRSTARIPSRPPTVPMDEDMPKSPWDLFCVWCAGGDAKDTRKALTMDFKEWVEMLKHLGVYPRKISKAKATEMFKQANRGAAGDGDTSELDWDEFDAAFRKLAETLAVHPNDVWCISKPSLRKPPDEAQAPMSKELAELFVKFAAGNNVKGGQSGKRAETMDAREFVSLCEHLLLVPQGVSKTFAMDTFTKAKQKGACKDKSELDLQGFEWAMRKISRQVGADFVTLHIVPVDEQDEGPKGAPPGTVKNLPRTATSKWKAAGQATMLAKSLARKT